jgi:hypothetical protein
MAKLHFKKWAKLAVIVAVFATLLLLPQPVQYHTAFGQGYGYGEPSPPSGGGGITDVTTSGGVFTETTTLTSADDNLVLLFPEGTTAETESGAPLASISITQVPTPPEPPQSMDFIGLCYDLKPDGATFDPPIELTFVYNTSWIPSGLGPQNLRIGYYNQSTQQWEMLYYEDISVVKGANSISVKISHFTKYSVMIYTAPAKFTVSKLAISPAEVEIAEKATISAEVANTGDVSGTTKVTLSINNVAVASKDIKLAGHKSSTVSFTTVQGQPGSYKVDVNGVAGTLTVKPASLKPVVITSTVPSIKVPEVKYPAPTAPTPPAVPAPVSAPTPWLAIIISLVATAIVAGVLVWNYGFRRE